MIQTTRNNHYFSLHEKGIDKVSKINLGKPIFTKRNLFEQSLIACSEIKEVYGNQDLYICLSGGIDSGSMLNAFYNSKVPFKVCIFYYYDNNGNLLNQHEINISENICKQYDLSYKQIKLNVIDYLESNEYMSFVEDSDIYCSSAQISVHMRCMNEIDGIPVYSGQVPGILIKRNHEFFLKDLEYWHKKCDNTSYRYNIFPEAKKYSFDVKFSKNTYIRATEDTADYSINRYMHKRGGGVTNFFYWSEEMLGSALSSRLYSDYIENRLGVNNYDFKFLVYKDQGFNISGRRLRKQTGFELIKEYFPLVDGENGFFTKFRKHLVKMHPECYDYNLIDYEYFLENGLSAKSS